MNENLVFRLDEGPVVVLTLNRPERRNALSRAMVAQLCDAVEGLASEPAVRALVLAARGPVFCAGMDLKEAAELGDSAEAESAAIGDLQGIADLIDALHRFPHPTIAAVEGDAIAGGAGLASACDFVIMAAEARIGYPEVRRGLVAAIVLHDLVRQVGDRRARDLLLTGRMIPADEARNCGLANRVVPADRCRVEAINLANDLLASAPLAIATIKNLIDEASSRPYDLRGAAAISAAVRVGDEAREGMLAFVEKRRASWDASP